MLPVEDNPVHWIDAQFALEQMRHQIRVANDGQEAIQMAAEVSQQSRAAGTDAVLGKPITREELRHLLIGTLPAAG